MWPEQLELRMALMHTAGYVLLCAAQRDVRVLLAAVLQGGGGCSLECGGSSSCPGLHACAHAHAAAAHQPAPPTTPMLLQPPDGVKWKALGLGELVDANRMSSTPFKLDFKENVHNAEVCSKQLNIEEMLRFRRVSASCKAERLLPPCPEPLPCPPTPPAAQASSLPPAGREGRLVLPNVLRRPADVGLCGQGGEVGRRAQGEPHAAQEDPVQVRLAGGLGGCVGAHPRPI